MISFVVRRATKARKVKVVSRIRSWLSNAKLQNCDFQKKYFSVTEGKSISLPRPTLNRIQVRLVQYLASSLGHRPRASLLSVGLSKPLG